MKFIIKSSALIAALANSLFAQNFTADLNIAEDSPQIRFQDTTSGHDDWWIHANAGRLYFLWDENDNGNWSGEDPWPLYFDGRKAHFSTDALFVDGNLDRVGIGTTSPSRPLQVTGASGYVLRVDVDSNIINHDSLIEFTGRDSGNSHHRYAGLGAEIRTSTNGAEKGDLWFATSSSTDGGQTVERMRIKHNGRVGIGTNDPTHKLSVNGTIRAKEIIVESGWSDYVFEDDYRLAPLSEVEAHIAAHGHLPGIPFATEIEQNGAKLSELVTLQMAKIEELTLHLIEKEKQLSSANERIENQAAEIAEIRRNHSQELSAIFDRLEALEN